MITNSFFKRNQHTLFFSTTATFTPYKSTNEEGIPTNEDLWFDFLLRHFDYATAQQQCKEYWSFDSTRSFRLKDFDEYYVNQVIMFDYDRVAGHDCPLIDPSLDAQACMDFYRMVDLTFYINRCFELGDSIRSTEPYGAEILEETTSSLAGVLPQIPQPDSVFYTPNFFDAHVLFELHKPLLIEEYFQIKLYIAFAIVLAVLIITASYLLVTQKPEPEKLSTYECGFEPYEDARNQFDVQFYVVAILFVLFDIEIIVLLPWCLTLSTVNLLGYWSVIEFLLELGLGFIYVWSVGALDW